MVKEVNKKLVKEFNAGTSRFFLYNFIRITMMLVTVVAASLEHVILSQIIDRFMAGLGRAGGA